MISKQDQRYLSLSTIAQIINKCIIFFNSIFVVYLISKNLSKEEIGIYLSITSLVGIFFIFDLGVGGSITIRILHAKNKYKKMIPLLITSSMIQAILITSFTFFLLTKLNFLDSFNFSNQFVKTEAILSVKTFIVIFGFILIASNLERIFLATSKATFFYGFSSTVQFISTFCIFFFLKDEINIAKILLISIGLPYALISLSSLYFFIGSNLSFSSITHEIKNEFEALSQHSLKFFIISIAILLSFGLDVYLIGYTNGFSYASEYSIIQRLFQIFVIPMMIMNGPLISIYNNLYLKNDFTKLKKLLKILLVIISIFSIVTFGIIYTLGNRLSSLWTSEKVTLDYALINAFGLKVSIEVFMYSLINYYNAINLIQKQFVFSVLIILISIPLKLYLINHYSAATMLWVYSLIYLCIYFFIFGFKIYPTESMYQNKTINNRSKNKHQ